MKYAAIFPGQGSQSLGMMSELAEQYSIVQETFSEASSVLSYDLWDVTQCQEENLNSTIYTQPAMLTAGVAAWRVWKEQSVPAPIVLAGHSLGEYTALVASDVMSFTDAVKAVQTRAKLMQEAVPAGEGAMAAILGLSDVEIKKVCHYASEGGVVEAVNFNAPGQVVIAGETEAVERATSAAKAAGAKRAIILPVSVPSHSSLMKGAAQQLSEVIDSIKFDNPVIPVIQNAEAKSYFSIDDIKKALVKQLYNPVLWVDSVQSMNVETYIELGPGKVLAGLSKRIHKGSVVACADSPAGLDKSKQIFNDE